MILFELELELELYFYLNTVNLSDKIIIRRKIDIVPQFLNVDPLPLLPDERLESVVERIWAIFNLYVLPFFVVVVVVALIAFRRFRVAKFWYFLSSFTFWFVLSRLANFLAYFLFILSAFFQCRVL